MHSILGASTNENTNPRRSKHQLLQQRKVLRKSRWLGARRTDCKWLVKRDTSWIQCDQCDDDQRPIGISFFERDVVCCGRTFHFAVKSVFCTRSTIPVEDTHTHVSSLVRYYLNVEPFVPIAVAERFDRR